MLALIRRPTNLLQRMPILAALVLLAGSSCAGKGGSPAAAPSRPTLSPASPSVPSASDGPSIPASVEAPWFVVGGGGGINGPSVVGAGVVSFSIANNGVSSHRFDLVRLRSQKSARQVAALVRRAGEDWPPASVRVLYQGPTQSSHETISAQVSPLKPGYYALVDLAPDPRGGKPYAYRTPYAWVIQAVDTAP